MESLLKIPALESAYGQDVTDIVLLAYNSEVHSH